MNNLIIQVIHKYHFNMMYVVVTPWNIGKDTALVLFPCILTLAKNDFK